MSRKTSLWIAASLLAMSAFAQPVNAQETSFPKVLIETSAGNITVELFSQRAPFTVENFLKYVDDDFYIGTLFHRVVAGFVVQGGGYDMDYKLKETRDPIPNESGNGLSNLRAYLAMARTSDPHTANSQFYINLADNTALDPRPTRWGYTVFGRVVDGMNVIDDIGYRATGPGPIPQLARDVPAEPIVIKKMIRLDDSTAAPTAPENVTIE
jgi:cyclophilin family peptidyl-prolyl cis-trans isomerase